MKIQVTKFRKYIVAGFIIKRRQFKTVAMGAAQNLRTVFLLGVIAVFIEPTLSQYTSPLKTERSGDDTAYLLRVTSPDKRASWVPQGRFGKRALNLASALANQNARSYRDKNRNIPDFDYGETSNKNLVRSIVDDDGVAPIRLALEDGRLLQAVRNAKRASWTPQGRFGKRWVPQGRFGKRSQSGKIFDFLQCARSLYFKS